MINPRLVDGQIQGGVIHGIGNALFERMIHDDQATPLSVNYGEYLLPMSAEMPRVEIHHLETPSPVNPIGVKGAGEGGTIPAAACIISGIEDALQPLRHPHQRAPRKPGADRRIGAPGDFPLPVALFSACGERVRERGGRLLSIGDTHSRARHRAIVGHASWECVSPNRYSLAPPNNSAYLPLGHRQIGGIKGGIQCLDMFAAPPPFSPRPSPSLRPMLRRR